MWRWEKKRMSFWSHRHLPISLPKWHMASPMICWVRRCSPAAVKRLWLRRWIQICMTIPSSSLISRYWGTLGWRWSSRIPVCSPARQSAGERCRRKIHCWTIFCRRSSMNMIWQGNVCLWRRELPGKPWIPCVISPIIPRERWDMRLPAQPHGGAPQWRLWAQPEDWRLPWASVWSRWRAHRICMRLSAARQTLMISLSRQQPSPITPRQRSVTRRSRKKKGTQCFPLWGRRISLPGLANIKEKISLCAVFPWRPRILWKIRGQNCIKRRRIWSPPIISGRRAPDLVQIPM